jgi:two-component system LytT family response regulator
MKALIVDDEQFCRDNLRMMVEEYCPEIREILMASDADEARSVVRESKPDVLFLDIKMPKESGFELLESLDNRNMSVIFTTAHNEYALKALKAQAVDYLEKPINYEELQLAVSKLKKPMGNDVNSMGEIKELIRKAYMDHEDDKIAVPMREGYEIIACRDLVHLEASESYTTLFLADGKKMLSSKNIKVYEDKLSDSTFFRVHKSHIINVRYHLRGFNRIDGNSAVMSNGKHIPIARRKLQPFLDRISEM